MLVATNSCNILMSVPHKVHLSFMAPNLIVVHLHSSSTHFVLTSAQFHFTIYATEYEGNEQQRIKYL